MKNLLDFPSLCDSLHCSHTIFIHSTWICCCFDVDLLSTDFIRGLENAKHAVPIPFMKSSSFLFVLIHSFILIQGIHELK